MNQQKYPRFWGTRY